MAITTITNSMVSVNAIQGTLIADNAITAVHIASNAVASIQIAENNVTAREIAANTITVAQLADDCVEADKIADGVITTNHLNKAMISSQTEVAVATGDFILLGDTSDSNNLKKAPISSILAGTLTTAAQTNITSLGTLTALTVDDITINGSTISDSGDLTIDTEADLTLTALSDIIHQTTSTNSTAGHHIFKSYNTEIMRIDGGNNRVGIGNASPSHMLHVNAADGASDNTQAMTIENNEATDGRSYGLKIKAGSTANDASLFVQDHDASNDHFIIRGNGKVGIGTTSPDTLLNLKDTGGIELRLEADSNNNGQEDCFIRFYTDGKTQEGIAGMDNNNSSTLFSGNTENAMVFGTVSNLPVVLATNNTERLQISAAGAATFAGAVAVGGNLDIAIASNTPYIRGGQVSTIFRNNANNASLLTILNGGNVGIGTTSPGEILHISSPADSYWALKVDCVNSNYGIQSVGQGSYAIGILNSSSNTYRGRWSHQGTIYSQDGSVHDVDSDERLKEDITDCPSQWSLIKDLPLQRFKWKDRRNGDTFSYGWVAQPTKAKYPEFVEPIPQTKEDIDAGKEDPEYLTVRSGNIQKRSIAALQEAMARIEALEAEVAALKG